MNWLYIYAAAFAGALALSAITTPIMRKIALKTGFLDRPLSEAHKRQTAPVALGGGVAMLASFLLCVIAVWGMDVSGIIERAGLSYSDSVYLNWGGGKIIATLTGAVLAAGIGFYDDKKAMKAQNKLFWQFIIAVIAVWPGEMRISLLGTTQAVTIPLSILWFVFIMNAINFFDNMDGLLSGTAGIAMVFFALTAALNQQFLVTSFAAASAGICAGFWLYNRAPASIYMGDCGSHFLGYLIATVSVMTTYFSSDSASGFQLFMPLLILAIPIIDALTVCVIRTANGKPFWIGDNNHISHRFVRLGLSKAQAVFCVHLLGIIFGLGAMPLLWGEWRTTAVMLLQALFLAALVLVVQFDAQKREPK